MTPDKALLDQITREIHGVAFERLTATARTQMYGLALQAMLVERLASLDASLMKSPWQ